MNREEVQKQLMIDEGVKYTIYLDHLGYPTFGIGHLITEKDPEYGQEVGTDINAKRVGEVFQSDLDITISECEALYEKWGDFPGEVQEILVNMMFNPTKENEQDVSLSPPKIVKTDKSTDDELDSDASDK